MHDEVLLKVVSGLDQRRDGSGISRSCKFCRISRPTEIKPDQVRGGFSAACSCQSSWFLQREQIRQVSLAIPQGRSNKLSLEFSSGFLVQWQGWVGAGLEFCARTEATEADALDDHRRRHTSMEVLINMNAMTSDTFRPEETSK